MPVNISQTSILCGLGSTVCSAVKIHLTINYSAISNLRLLETEFLERPKVTNHATAAIFEPRPSAYANQAIPQRYFEHRFRALQTMPHKAQGNHHYWGL